MVASIVAHHGNSEVDIIQPDAELARSVSGLGRAAYGLASRFSPRAAKFAEQKLEGVARAKIESEAHKIIALKELMAGMPNPRGQFIRELTGIYDHVMRDPQSSDVEDNLALLMEAMKDLRNRITERPLIHRWFNIQDYPLLANLWLQFRLPVPYLGDHQYTATPDIMKGISQFIHEKKRFSVGPPLSADKGLLRQGAEMFAGDTLRAVPGKIGFILNKIYDVLPESGVEFARNIQLVSENIVRSKMQGVDDRQIAEEVFRDFRS